MIANDDELWACPVRRACRRTAPEKLDIIGEPPNRGREYVYHWQNVPHLKLRHRD